MPNFSGNVFNASLPGSEMSHGVLLLGTCHETKELSSDSPDKGGELGEVLPLEKKTAWKLLRFG